MIKSKLIPLGCLVLSLAVFLLVMGMSCTRIEAPLEPVSLTPLPSSPQPTATPAPTAAVTPTVVPTSAPTPEGHFQNFEENNGTPGLYFQDFGSANSVFTSQAFEGARALQTTGSAVAAASVRIYPGAASVDLTLPGTIWVMVYSPVGEQNFDLTLADAAGVTRTASSSSATNPNTWTMIYWSLNNFTGVNRAAIVYGTITLPIPETFRFDDLRSGDF